MKKRQLFTVLIGVGMWVFSGACGEESSDSQGNIVKNRGSSNEDSNPENLFATSCLNDNDCSHSHKCCLIEDMSMVGPISVCKPTGESCP